MATVADLSPEQRANLLSAFQTIEREEPLKFVMLIKELGFDNYAREVYISKLRNEIEKQVRQEMPDADEEQIRLQVEAVTEEFLSTLA